MNKTLYASEGLALTFEDPSGIEVLPESSAGPGTEQLVTGEGILVTLERIAVDEGPEPVTEDEILRGWVVSTTQHYRQERGGRDLLAGFVAPRGRRGFGLVLSYAAAVPEAAPRRFAACAALRLDGGSAVGLQLNWGAQEGAEPRGELLDRAFAGLAPNG